MHHVEAFPCEFYMVNYLLVIELIRQFLFFTLLFKNLAFLKSDILNLLMCLIEWTPQANVLLGEPILLV